MKKIVDGKNFNYGLISIHHYILITSSLLGHLKKVNKSNEWLQWRISDLERQVILCFDLIVTNHRATATSRRKLLFSTVTFPRRHKVAGG